MAQAAGPFHTTLVRLPNGTRTDPGEKALKSSVTSLTTPDIPDIKPIYVLWDCWSSFMDPVRQKGLGGGPDIWDDSDQTATGFVDG